MGMTMCMALAIAGCGMSEKSAGTVSIREAAATEEQTVTVVRGDIAVVTELDAWVGPAITQLTFEEEGTFGAFKVALGDEVKKGEVLAVPAVEQQKEAWEAQKVTVEALREDYEYRRATLENQLEITKLRLQKVYDQLELVEYGTPEYTGLCVSAGEYDEGRKRLELQLAQMEEAYALESAHARSVLKKLEQKSTGNQIIAPCDGIVVALSEATYGSAISINSYYVAVADPSVVYARCEGQSISALLGMEEIVFWKDGRTYSAQPVQRDSRFYLEMRSNPDDNFTEFLLEDENGELSFGEYGLISMTSRRKEDVLLLPETAIGALGGDAYVYKDVGGMKQQVGIKTGYRDGLMVEIVSGLEEGDIVYVQD